MVAFKQKCRGQNGMPALLLNSLVVWKVLVSNKRTKSS